MLRRKFRAMNAYIQQEERSQIKNLIFHLKKLFLKRAEKTQVNTRKNKGQNQ